MTCPWCVLADSAARAKLFVRAQPRSRLLAASQESDNSFLVGLGRWAGARAAIAAPSCAQSSGVTVSPANSAEGGSVDESVCWCWNSSLRGRIMYISFGYGRCILLGYRRCILQSQHLRKSSEQLHSLFCVYILS
jgi:hypothetical protein